MSEYSDLPSCYWDYIQTHRKNPDLHGFVRDNLIWLLSIPESDFIW